MGGDIIEQVTILNEMNLSPRAVPWDSPSGVVEQVILKAEDTTCSTISSLEMSAGENQEKGLAEPYANEDLAVEKLTSTELQRMYPMLCFCDPAGTQVPCRSCPSGHKGRLPAKYKFLYAWPACAWMALKYQKVGYMQKFYTDDYPRASLGMMSFGVVLGVLMDAFTDPKMAVWTDTLRSPFGRRRPFMLGAAFFVPVAFVLSWTPLGPPGLAASIWFTAFHLLTKLTDTTFNIPHDAWGAQLTPAYREKTQVWVWKDMLSNLGILMGMAVLPLVLNTAMGLPMWVTALVLGAVFMQASLHLFWSGKEPMDGHVSEETQRRTVSFSEDDTVPMLVSTWLNRPFRLLLVNAVVKSLGQDVPFTVLPYVLQWVVGEKCFHSEEFFGVLAMANITSSLIGVLAWKWFAGKTNKYFAVLFYNLTLAVTSLSFLSITPDTGDCKMSYLSLVLVCLFGFAYGGTFLVKDLVSDTIDYDEFLSGGRRREANYLMALEFIPKFVAIPGECVPLLLMAAFGYARPLPEAYKPQCTSDAFCGSHYANETAGAGWCSESMTCADLHRSGVQFICANSFGTCSIEQNPSVQRLLSLSFSVVPCVCMLAGLATLMCYPKHARSQASHEQLLRATSQVKRGETVEDPWRPGNFVYPVRAPGVLFGELSYFWPSELARALKIANSTPSGEGPTVQPAAAAAAAAASLFRKPLLGAAFWFAVVLLGVYLTISGLEDLWSSDLGVSISPVGLMVLGIGLLGTWFEATRAKTALALRRREGLTVDDIRRKYNRYCCFEGKPVMHSHNEESGHVSKQEDPKLQASDFHSTRGQVQRSGSEETCCSGWPPFTDGFSCEFHSARC